MPCFLSISMPRTVAISACLLGKACRYDGTDNKDAALLEVLEDDVLIPFCPEDFAFGTPRPTMDLVETPAGKRAVSNATGEDLSEPLLMYAKDFFDAHPQIDLYIGKDKSPSCGVCTARVYDENKNLLSSQASGLMAQAALDRGIPAFGATQIKES